MTGARCACGRKPRANVGPCSRCYHRKWRAENLAARRAVAVDYYRRNRARILAYKAAWRAKERAERKRVPHERHDVYAQAIVRVPVSGWGYRARPPIHIEDSPT